MTWSEPEGFEPMKDPEVLPLFIKEKSMTDTGPFKIVGHMRLSLAKSFGILFGLFLAFFFFYFIWSFFYDSTTVFQLIQRGANVAIFGYITYAIHSDIRSRIRYERDDALYRQVGELIERDQDRTERIIGHDHGRSTGLTPGSDIAKILSEDPPWMRPDYPHYYPKPDSE